MAQAGAAGVAGTAGPQGLAGPQGPIGLTGAQGPVGVAGPQGPVGGYGPAGNNGTNGTNGAGFNFRGAFNTSNTYALNDTVTFISPDITYNVNLPFGNSGSFVGTITTDGTIGVLGSSNIVSWNLTLNDGSKVTILTPSTSTSSWYGGDLSATSTSLLFNYTIGDNGFGGFSGSGGQFCITSQTNCFGPADTYGSWGVGGDSWVYSSGSGVQTIASGGAATFGGMSTYVATGPIAAGTAIPGMLPWVMMAQAGAAGAVGATGSVGPQGLLGLTGATGAQGPTGNTGGQGPTGNTGPQGPIGNNGLNGAVGATGPQGPQGIQGPIGPAGNNGTNGTNGTGFNFRGAFNTSNTYALNDVVTFAPSTITYNVSLTFDQSWCSQPGCNTGTSVPPAGSGTAIGTITTDGTIGALSPSNIVSFNLTLYDGSHTGVLTPSNGATVVGNGLSATSTNLSVDYGITASFVGAGGQLCFSGNWNCFPGGGAGMWGVGGNNLWIWTGGVEPIATGGTVSIGSASTYIATSSVAANGLVPPTSPWVMLAQAGATGSTGPAGSAGLTGTTGATGLQGPAGLSVQGPEGITGPPGPVGPAGPTGASATAFYSLVTIGGQWPVGSNSNIAWSASTALPASASEYFVNTTITFGFGSTGGTAIPGVLVGCYITPQNGDSNNPNIQTNSSTTVFTPAGGGMSTLVLVGIVPAGSTPEIVCFSEPTTPNVTFGVSNFSSVTFTPVSTLTKF